MRRSKDLVSGNPSSSPPRPRFNSQDAPLAEIFGSRGWFSERQARALRESKAAAPNTPYSPPPTGVAQEGLAPLRSSNLVLPPDSVETARPGDPEPRDQRAWGLKETVSPPNGSRGIKVSCEGSQVSARGKT